MILSNHMKKWLRTLLLFVVFIWSILSITPALATGDTTYKVNVGIPGTKFGPDQTVTVGPNTLGDLVRAFYKFSVPLAGVVAIVIILAAGLTRIVAGGDSSRVEFSGELMWAGIIGLGIVLISWVILNTINPDLVNPQPIAPEVVKKINARPPPSVTLTVAPRDRSDPAAAANDRNRLYQQGRGVCEVKDASGNVLYCFRNISAQECTEAQTAAGSSLSGSRQTMTFRDNATACGTDGKAPDGGACVEGLGTQTGTCTMAASGNCEVTGVLTRFNPFGTERQWVVNNTCAQFGACMTSTGCMFVQGSNCPNGQQFVRGTTCANVPGRP